MSLIAFLKDRRFSIVAELMGGVAVSAIVWELSRNLVLAAFIATLLIVIDLVALTVAFVPRHRYYGELREAAETLDNPNLMIEVTPEPSFEEGRIVHGLLRSANKSMLESVELYKDREHEYREYIELWVHEIKTPIASAKLVAENHAGPSTEAMLEEVERIERLVEQTLFYARSTGVDRDLLVREVSLASVVNPAVRQHAREFIGRGISLQTSGLDLLVYTDVKWATFIVSQVLSNSIAYTPESGARVKIGATRRDGHVVLTIADNGCGILPEELPRVFDKGFTGTNGRRNTHATGIGLYLVHQLAERIEVCVSIESDVDEGTCASLMFPARGQA